MIWGDSCWSKLKANLNIGVTRAIFRLQGKTPVSIDFINSLDIKGEILSTQVL